MLLEILAKTVIADPYLLPTSTGYLLRRGLLSRDFVSIPSGFGSFHFFVGLKTEALKASLKSSYSPVEWHQLEGLEHVVSQRSLQPIYMLRIVLEHLAKSFWHRRRGKPRHETSPVVHRVEGEMASPPESSNTGVFLRPEPVRCYLPVGYPGKPSGAPPSRKNESSQSLASQIACSDSLRI